MNKIRILAVIGAVWTQAVLYSPAAPLGTAFTYQGKLTDADKTASGVYDFSFKLYDDATAGGQKGPEVTVSAVPVDQGYFEVTLDFGDNFPGEARWLAITVRTNGAGAYTPLSPRQLLAPAPHAIFASSAATAASAASAGSATVAGGVAPGSVGAAGIASGQVVKSLNLLRDDVALAAGANLTLTPAGQTLTLSSPDDWHLLGNAGTMPGTHFLGTADNNPLQFKVNGAVALRLEPTASGPNIIGGGMNNQIAAYGSFIGNGGNNEIQYGAFGSIIGAGANNVIRSNAYYSFIGSGFGNQIQGTNGQAALYGLIGGGLNNLIEPYGYYSSVVGGSANRIQYNSDYVVIAGGSNNQIGTNADYATISGGSANIISNDATHATIPGGYFNSVGKSYGFAAGYQARANHLGSFVWADGSGGSFGSTANNQFLIRAAGNVGINKNNPATALDVNGVVTATGFSGPGGSVSGTSVSLNVNEYLNDKDIYLRGDSNHGLGWYGAGKLFAGNNVNGPVLYGFDGGALGTTSGGQKVALSWNKDSNVNVVGALVVDYGNGNTGSVSTASLTLGLSSGEGIGSKRNAGGNQYGLDFYTGFFNRLSIANDGSTHLNDNTLFLRPVGDGNHGLVWRDTVAGLRFDGPFIFGWEGGALGSVGPDEVSLKWDFTGNVWISNNCSVATLTIRGGADLAEPFDFSSEQDVSQGAVVIIDDQHPGRLKLSERAYDTRVAGVVSGANGVHPGIQMMQQGLIEGGKNVALTGRVYVQADTSNGPIRPGDLLTTSARPGHAMKVTDHRQAQGAILGKAMTGLAKDDGLILVLVTLQ